MIVTGDVLIHTWDLARATGQDETLDAALVADMWEGMQPMDEMLRASGHYGPKVAVPETADVQTEAHRLHGPYPLTGCRAVQSQPWTRSSWESTRARRHVSPRSKQRTSPSNWVGRCTW